MNETPLQIRAQFLAGAIDKHAYSAQMHRCHTVLFDYSQLLKGTWLEQIQITEDHVLLLTRTGLRFSLDPSDHYVPPTQLLNFGAYEASEGALLEQLLQPGFCVFDVGANIGWYAVTLAHRFPTCRVYAFEPIRPTFERLERHIALNRLTNVTALNFGLSDQDRENPFFFSPEISGAASGADILGRSTVQTVTSRVRRLDDVWHELKVRVDLIKCDVEGAELLVLQGGLGCIASDQPLILCEMLRKWSAKFHYHPNQIITLLAAQGYACYAIAGETLERLEHMDENTVPTNFLFFHKERHYDLLQQLAREKRLQL